MTSPDDPKNAESEKPVDEAAATESDAPPEPKPDSDPLPPVQERTAEYVEEEAVRGDFVLRWSIILLAFLLGFSQTDSSRALVHARSGQYMQSNGFLPPRVDVFSSTADGEPWVQTSWVFDHLSGALHAMLGASSFTILSALFAAVAFGYAVHTAIPRVSTWWTVICCAFALLACYPRFTPTPELVTLAFLAVTLSWLYRWQTSDGDGGFPWRIPILFVVWANCDPRMWMGIALIALYGIGHGIDRLMGRRGWTLPGRGAYIGPLVGACLVAALANPFGWNTLTEPVRQYGTEYPALRTYYPLSEVNDVTKERESTIQYHGFGNALVIMARQKSTLAGLAIVLVSIALFIVNMKNLDTGYLLALIGFGALCLIATHELAATALLAAVLAGLNGQDWYRQNFQTEYSTDVKQMVFSQGGRAMTVLALFGFAFLGVSGHLTGKDGVRVGLGLDPNLRAAVDGMGEELAEIDKDKNIFNFTPEQGDLLIWHDRKSFIDSRMALFGGGKGSVVERHIATRPAFRQKRQGLAATNDRRVWEKTLREFNITYVAPRLYGGGPDYQTYRDLYTSADWSLDKLGASGAYFRKVELGEPAAKLDFVKLGLKTNVKDPQPRLDWGQPLGFYDEFVRVPKRVYRARSQLAQHYREHLMIPSPPGDLIGACYLTIRAANEALAANPNDAIAYRALGDAYLMLDNIEGQFAQNVGGAYPNVLRYRLAISAYRQSLNVDPEQEGLLGSVFQLYLQNGKAELAVKYMGQYLELVEQRADDLTDNESNLLENQYRQWNQLKSQSEAAVKRVQDMRAQMKEQKSLTPNVQPNPGDEARELVEFASNVARQGLTIFAQNELEQESEVLAGYPQAQRLYGELLIENGELEDAAVLFAQMRQLAEERPKAVEGIAWQFDAASIAMIGGDYKTARDIWGEEFKVLEKMSQSMSAQQGKIYLPIVTPPSVWPQVQASALHGMLVDAPGNAARVRFFMALTLVEEGRTTAAASLLKQLVDAAPATTSSQLAQYYYALITDKQLQYDFDPGYVPLDLNAPEEPEGEEEGTPDAGEAAAPNAPK